MFSFTLPVFRHLVRRSYYRSMCTNMAKKNGTMLQGNDMSESELECNEIELDNVLELEKYAIPKNKDPSLYIELGGHKIHKDLTRKGVNFTCKCLADLNDPDEQDWENLTKKLKILKVPNVTTKILQACIRLNKLDFGMSYYNYLEKQGQQLSVLDVMFFSKLLLQKKSEIPKYEDLIIKFYNSVKDYLLTSSLLRTFNIEIFSEVPTCFLDIVKNRHLKAEISRTGNFHLIKKALEMDMYDVAVDYMKDPDFITSEAFLESYINFCIRKVKEGKFSVDLINNLMEISEKKALTWNHSHLEDKLNALVDVLMQHQDEYVWSVKQCELSENSVCSNCNLTLIPKPISQKEFEHLKQHFFNKAFVQNNIFLNSSKQEITRFLKFLKNAAPYDVVLDGLNLMYKNKIFGTQNNNMCLKYFLNKGFKVLTIGRIHSRTLLTKGINFDSKKNQKNAQFFFTSDSSDDDLFVLYATLQGSLNTFFVTGDMLSTYAKNLDSELKCVFLRWKMSHQFMVTPDVQLLPPLPHCGLPQLTHSPTEQDDKYVWHISHQSGLRRKICPTSPLYWYCLQAVRKKKMQLSWNHDKD